MLQGKTRRKEKPVEQEVEMDIHLGRDGNASGTSSVTASVDLGCRCECELGSFGDNWFRSRSACGTSRKSRKGRVEHSGSRVRCDNA
jgi:hypothetical protein